jgi:uncharacterized membrane protein (UPF0182 family)
VIRGLQLVIPVKNSLLYVEPLYLTAEAAGGLPQLSKVIVAYGDQVVMQDTLDDALSQIFGTTISTQLAQALPTLNPNVKGEKLVHVKGQTVASAPTPAAAANQQQFKALTQQANQQYEQALQLLKQGDWAGYGNEIKKLGQTLNQLASMQK